MTTANAINANSTGLVRYDGAGAFDSVTTTQHDLLIGAASNGITSVAPSATSGVPVISQGAAADPTFGTAVVAGGGTGATTLTNHGVLIGQGTSAVAATAAGTAGQVLQSGGASADPSYSTATFPSTASSAGKFLRADGTNWAASTMTIPDTVATSDILYASATNVLSALTTVASRLLATNSSGVPGWRTQLDFNLSIVRTISGSTVTMQVQNQSNTANSNAAYLATTSGSSAGDPLYRFETGVTTWCIGSDNSVSSPSDDPLKISLNSVPGTNDIWIGWQGGQINLPLQPCFLAYNSSSDAGQTKGGFVTVQLDTEVFDQGNNFASNTFTAPVTGKYLFNACICITGINSATRFEGYLTASNRQVTLFRVNPSTLVATGSNLVGFSGSCIIDMDAADTCVLQVVVDGGTSTYTIAGSSDTVTYMSGQLLA